MYPDVKYPDALKSCSKLPNLKIFPPAQKASISTNPSQIPCLTKNSNTHSNFPTSQMTQKTSFLKSYTHLKLFLNLHMYSLIPQKPPNRKTTH